MKNSVIASKKLDN